MKTAMDPVNSSQESSTPGTIRVACVDDHESIRSVMRLVIDSESDMKCVGCLSSCNDLVNEIRLLNPDVVLLDATMPGVNPLTAMADLKEKMPSVKTIIFSAHDNQSFIDSVMRAGAWGYISKNDEPALILRAVREAARSR